MKGGEETRTIMTSGVDYSKWDKFDVSSSSGDEEEKILPRVTKLERPCTVTRSCDGTISMRHEDDGLDDQVDMKENDNGSEMNVSNDTSSLSRDVKSQPTGTRRSIEFVKARAVSKRESLVRNGGKFHDRTLSFWSQDRNEVVLSVTFNPHKISPRNIRVAVVGILPYSERYSAVGWHTTINNEEDDKVTNGGSLTVVTTTSVTASSPTTPSQSISSHSLGRKQEGNIVITGILPHIVHLPDDEDEVEWEISDCDTFGIDKAEYGECTKMIRITLRKAVPTSGITVWWSQPLLHWPTIDVSEIKDRGMNSKKQEEIKKSWDEAHRLFQQKISSKEKHVVNIDDIQD